FTTAEEHSMRDIERLTGQKVERVLRPEFGGYLSVSPTLAAKPAPTARKSFRSFRPRRSR
ncbi:MAG: hypothetical protein ACREO5_06455, partial [Candidatus Binatia bacterium]